MEGAYETIPKSMYEMPKFLPNTMMISLETEKQIYDDPLEIQKDYGPIYHEPPSNVKKIYEEFEGKRFHKISHHEVRYVVLYIKFHYRAISTHCTYVIVVTWA